MRSTTQKLNGTSIHLKPHIFINPATKQNNTVMPDLIRHPVHFLISTGRLASSHLIGKIDGLVKSLNSSFSVIPAKAGIQYFQILLDACLRRACPCGGRGMTEFRTFYETIKNKLIKNYYTWSGSYRAD